MRGTQHKTKRFQTLYPQHLAYLRPAQVVRRHPWLLTKQNIPYGKLAFRGQLPHKVYSVPLRRPVSDSAGKLPVLALVLTPLELLLLRSPHGKGKMSNSTFPVVSTILPKQTLCPRVHNYLYLLRG